MKKIVKTLICILIIVSVTVSIVSCKRSRPEGYTGGISGVPPTYYMQNKIHWLETFDEVTTVIGYLRAAGNDIPDTYISSYETDTVDAKYMIICNVEGIPKQKDGEEWYDRKYKSVNVTYYGFLDKISIEELEYSRLNLYRVIELCSREIKDKKEEPVHWRNIYCTCEKIEETYLDQKKFREVCYLRSRISDVDLATVNYKNIEDHNEELPENFHDDFLKTIVFIG